MRRRPLHPTGWTPPLALRGHAFACIPDADAVPADLFTSPLPAIPTVWQCRCGLTLDVAGVLALHSPAPDEPWCSRATVAIGAAA